jgi:hypothetical protein
LICGALGEIMSDGKQDVNASDQQRVVIRMQLYKEVYILNQGEIRNYAGNIADDRARKAVEAFDRCFDE